MSTERYSRDREQALAEVHAFLGVDADFVTPPRRVRNPFVEFRSQRLRRPIRSLPSPLRKVAGRLNVRKSSYPPMGAAVRAELEAAFTGPNRELRSLTDVGEGWQAQRAAS